MDKRSFSSLRELEELALKASHIVVLSDNETEPEKDGNGDGTGTTEGDGDGSSSGKNNGDGAGTGNDGKKSEGSGSSDEGIGQTLMKGEAGFDRLQEALGAGNLDDAFEAAHALKGMLGNLSLTPMYEKSCEITELLRARTQMDYTPLITELLSMRDTLRVLCD